MKLFEAVKNLANKAIDVVDKLINDDECDAVIAATVLISAADGKIDEKEKEAAFNGIRNHQCFQAFEPSVIRKKFDDAAKLINSDRVLAEEVLYDKVGKIKDKVARIRMLGIVSEIAEADGDFSEAEKKVVSKLRSLTG